MCYDAALQEDAARPRRCRCRPRPAWRHAGADGARSEGDRGDRRSGFSRPSIRCCSPNMPAAARAASSNMVDACRDRRRRRVGRQQRAQLPQQASALHEHGQGLAASTSIWCSGLDVQGLGKAAHRAQLARHAQLETLVPANCDLLEIGFGEIGISKWAMDYCRMQPCLRARARRHRASACLSSTRICERAHRQRFQAQEPHRRAQGRDRQAP